MSLTYKQSKVSAFNGAGLTTTAAFTSNPTAGNLLLAGVRWTNTVTITGLQDTNGNNWVQIGPTQATTGYRFAVYQCQSNLATHANTVQVNWSTNTAGDGLLIAEYSGQASGTSLDNFTFTGPTASTSVAAGPVVASKINESIITIGMTNGGSAVTSTALTQNIRQSGSTNNVSLLDLAETAAGSYSDTIHNAGSQTQFYCMMTFFSTTSASASGQTGLQLAMDASLRNSGLRH